MDVRGPVSVSVVVPFHEQGLAANQSDCRLARVLSSLDSTRPQAAEIICVDDNSPVPYDAMVRGRGARYIRTSARPERPHVGRRALARQIGLKAAKHEIVLFLDGDILVPTSLMQEIVVAARDHGDKAMVFAPRRDVLMDGDLPSLFSRREQYSEPKTFRLYDHGAGVQLPVWAALSSHCFAVNREFVTDAGGWDENFIGWGEEDIELFYRLWKQGGQIVRLDHVIVQHLVHPVDHDENRKSMARNARYFMAKHPDVASSRLAFYQQFGISLASDVHE